MNLDYELIDCGETRRLERFGDIILDRPCPQAIWHKKLGTNIWDKIDAYYERSDDKKDWNNVKNIPDTWNINLDELVFELRLSQNNQVGIFPEQLENWSWIHKHIKNKSDKNLKILNCFAYTGVASLVSSFSLSSDIEVCHVDGAKSAVNWAKQNAVLSGLSQKKTRWIVDDVITFMNREIKRGNKYDGIILDPPAFGRGGKSSWKFEKDLPHMLKLVSKLLTPDPSFVILSGHAPGVSSSDLLRLLEDNISSRVKEGEAIDLIIPSQHGNDLPSSICARVLF